MKDDRTRVVVTGLGVVAPNGVGADEFARACLAGRSGISALDLADRSGLKSVATAQVLGFDPTVVMEPAEARRVPRMVPLALAASREALTMAGLGSGADDVDAGRKMGVSLGTGGGGMAFVEEQYRTLFTEGRGSVFSITAGTHGNLSSELSIALGLRGPSHVLSTGCTSSTDAIGYAILCIRAGIVPMMLAGGADAPIARGILMGFEKMRVVSTRPWPRPQQASRPFDLRRDGFVLGEGAWMFVLESLAHARERGAAILGELAGYASTCDAFHRVQIAPDVAEPVRAMELALVDAQVEKQQVAYIALHGTGTELNDRLETAAVHKCFGDHARRLCGSSIKSMIGHPQGACGAAGVAATLLAMRSGMLPPTVNLDEPDPACDLDYIPHTARQLQVNVALCNCIAFGSKNSAIVLRRADGMD